MGLFESLNKELIAVIQLLSHVGLSTAWTAQASLSFTISLSLLRFMFIESLTIPVSATLFSFCFQSFLASDKLVLENDNMGIIDFDHLLFSLIKIKIDFFRGNLSLDFPGGFPSKMCKMFFCFFWSCNSFYFLCLKANRKQTLILLYMNKTSACNVGDLGLIPGLERSPGEGNGNPLQYFCLENAMDGGVSGYSQWDCRELYPTKQLYFLWTHISGTTLQSLCLGIENKNIKYKKVCKMLGCMLPQGSTDITYYAFFLPNPKWAPEIKLWAKGSCLMVADRSSTLTRNTLHLGYSYLYPGWS